MKRICFFHIGAHKTGTSSVQAFLATNQETLERHGVYIPRAGRVAPETGHHNLAWDIIGNGLFNPQFGSWRMALEEISSSHAPVACITAEDFIFCYRQPDTLRRIQDDLGAIGYEVRIVIYLRSQAEYIESVYSEMVKHGETLGFRTYMSEINRNLARDSKAAVAYPFDYLELLDSWAKVFGADAIEVRRYRATRPSKYLLKDFLSVISQGRPIRGVRFQGRDLRLNTRWSFERVVQRLRANRLKAGEVDVVAGVPSRGFTTGPFDPLDLHDLMAIHRRFRETNLQLWDKYRVKVSTMMTRRLMREVMCSAGLNPDAKRRREFLARLDTCETPG